MRIKSYIICTLMLLLVIACGQQHDAEVVIKDFMKENMVNYSEIDDLKFTDIDSTKRITDSIVTAMRKAANTSKVYKKNIIYKEYTGNNMIMSRINYKLDNKDYSDTYYLNSELTHIIAFKINQE